MLYTITVEDDTGCEWSVVTNPDGGPFLIDTKHGVGHLTQDEVKSILNRWKFDNGFNKITIERS